MMVLSLLIGFQQAIIVLHFKLNQKAIVDEFCINKNQPKLHCEGKCFLKKQLQKTDQSDPSATHTYQKVDMFFISNMDLDIKHLATEIKHKKVAAKRTIYTAPHLEIFVPPPIPLLI